MVRRANFTILGLAAMFWAIRTDGAEVRPAAVSFRADVMAVLSKAGCNLGVCHGNKNGKGGFKLSLRGEDPEWDFAALTRDLSGRRGNPVEPDQSLLLLKPTMQVPHEGGRRFKTDSAEFAILRNWVAGGMRRDGDGQASLQSLEVSPREAVIVEPEETMSIRVSARFSNGTTRDVGGLAVYELSNPIVEVSHDGMVRRNRFGETTVIVRFLQQQVPVRLAFVPARPEFVWNGPAPVNVVDEHIFAKLKALRMNPSPVCDDTVFVRRAFLDLLGILPTAEEARKFVQDGQPDKRRALVDELLQRQEFADFWAQKWSDLLRVEEITLDRKGVQNFHAWIRHGIATGKPLDQFVRELIASRGSTYTEPASNYYRAMREPLMRAESTAQIFLGVRLQCTKCHNHPFDRWTQDDYYGWANLFARVDYRVLENNRKDNNNSHEFDGEQIVFMKRKGDVENPRTGKAADLRLLGESGKSLRSDTDRLVELADWLTQPGNTRFVETQVNRVWYHLLGQGIVDPIDDFRATNPPSNPQLLDALCKDFVAHRFDVRHLIRTVMASRTYQLSSARNDTNREDETSFSHARPQRLTAEQFLDSLSRVADVPLEFAGYPAGMRAGELPGVRVFSRERDGGTSSADNFLKLFGKPPRLQACECERSNEPTLSQTFQMISGPMINELLSKRDNRLKKLLESDRPAAEMLDELYWSALSRAPTAEELAATVKYLGDGENRRSRLEDIAWGLLNSNEFLLRR